MRSAPYTPKKSLGQHFLHDRNIARNIVAQLDPRPGETVLEIGPGPGVLTSLLAETGCRVIAADIDQRAVDTLRGMFPAEKFPLVEPVHADILSLDLSALGGSEAAPLRVLGNLPYNITSQILFRLRNNFV